MRRSKCTTEYAGKPRSMWGRFGRPLLGRAASELIDSVTTRAAPGTPELTQTGTKVDKHLRTAGRHTRDNRTHDLIARKIRHDRAGPLLRAGRWRETVA